MCAEKKTTQKETIFDVNFDYVIGKFSQANERTQDRKIIVTLHIVYYVEKEHSHRNNAGWFETRWRKQILWTGQKRILNDIINDYTYSNIVLSNNEIGVSARATWHLT